MTTAENNQQNISTQPYERHASPENSAWYRNTLFTFLADGKDTKGQMAVVELTPKRGLEPGPHTHTKEDEAYYVIEGEVTFIAGHQKFEAKPGSYVFLPRGIQHHFLIQTPKARMLILLMPSGFENFFRALAHPIKGDDLLTAPQTEFDMTQVHALEEQHGIILPNENS